VKVAEGVDAGIAVACPGPCAVIGHHTVVVGVVRGIVLQTDSVVVLDAVLDRWRVECVIPGGRRFERPSIGPGSIDSQVANRAVGRRNQIESEGAVIEAAGARRSRLIIGDRQSYYRLVALNFIKSHDSVLYPAGTCALD